MSDANIQYDNSISYFVSTMYVYSAPKQKRILETFICCTDKEWFNTCYASPQLISDISNNMAANIHFIQKSV